MKGETIGAALIIAVAVMVGVLATGGPVWAGAGFASVCATVIIWVDG